MEIHIFPGKSNSYKFKTIEANCDNFEITGSIAYNDNKSSIFISDVSYCGGTDDTKYEKIECSLFEINNNKSSKISDCSYDYDGELTLNKYLDNVKLNVEVEQTICKEYADNNLLLELEAYDEDNRVTSYKIPLKVNENCKK